MTTTHPAATPAAYTPATATEYEYRQCPADAKLIQVRFKQPKRCYYPAWSVYMLCNTEAHAEHVLYLLQHADCAAVGVLP